MRSEVLAMAIGNGKARDCQSRALDVVMWALVAVGLWLSPSLAVADELDSARLAEGRSLYAKHCASCHGVNLEGQPNWRQRKPDGRLPAPPHDETGHTWHHPDTQLLEITKLGTEAMVGGGYKSDMPGFAGILSDREIGAVLAYIKSTWPERIRRRHDAMNGRTKQ